MLTQFNTGLKSAALPAIWVFWIWLNELWCTLAYVQEQWIQVNVGIITCVNDKTPPRFKVWRCITKRGHGSRHYLWCRSGSDLSHVTGFGWSCTSSSETTFKSCVDSGISGFCTSSLCLSLTKYHLSAGQWIDSPPDVPPFMYRYPTQTSVQHRIWCGGGHCVGCWYK